MNKNWKIKFRNVGQTYFPQTRVECFYTLSSHYNWSRHDWIGLFKVGWTSVRDYYTFAWALAPEGYMPGKDANCSVLFHPSYLPNPGETAFQFVYVDEIGIICAESPQFTFSAPRPLDELVTLTEERNGDDENEGDLLLVVPKAHILQNNLENCQHELKRLQKKLEAVTDEVQKHRERNGIERNDFEKERAEMKSEIEDLGERLKCSTEKLERTEEKIKDVLRSHENITAELNDLLAERLENQQLIKDLKEDLSNLTQQKQETEAELERIKERIKKMTTQRREEEDERKTLQIESEQAREELHTLKERLEASEHSTEALRRDLSELGALQGHSHAELHQVRLQAAQMTLQLSQANLALREGQASWAHERESMRQNAELDKDRVQKLSRELQKKEEWLQEERTEREKLEVELGNEKDCNREMRASLRAIQKEREQQQLEKQELLDHIRVLQLRMDREADTKWTEAATMMTLYTDRATAATDSFTQADLEEANEIQPQFQADKDEDSPEEIVDNRSLLITEEYKKIKKEMGSLTVLSDLNVIEDKLTELSEVSEDQEQIIW